MEKVVNGGGNSRRLKRILLVFLSVFMLVFGSVLLTGCGETEASEYYILLMDEDEITELYGNYVAAGAKIEGIPTPTKDPTAQYTYAFAGWVDEDGNKYVPTVATKNVTAYATYTASPREYSLTILANDEEISSYEQVEVLCENKYLTTGATVHYGDKLQVTVNGSDGYSVTGTANFTGVDKVVEDGEIYYVVTGDVTISYTEEQETYTVTFYDVDGTKLYSTTATYGSSVTYPNDDPTRATDLRASYVFDNWVDTSGNYVNINKITGDTKVYAQYVETYISYYLTIDSGAKVYVYKNGTQITTGTVIHYGDELQIVANPTEGHYVSSLKVNDSEIMLSDNMASVVVDENGVHVSYEETIYTYNVTLYNGDTTFATYTGVEYGSAVSPENPTKASTLRGDYSFVNWVDSDGNIVSLTSIKSNITAWAKYDETLIEYSISVSDRVTVTLEDGTTVTSSNASKTVIYYDDTFTVEYDLADGYTLNTFDVQNANLSDSTYTIAGNVTITFAMQKTFVADKYQNMQEFAGFVDSNGNSLCTASNCTQKDGYMFFTYVGTEEVTATAKYSDFLSMEALVYTSYGGTSCGTTAVKWDSLTYTWTGGGAATNTYYFTTALYKGMEIEFTITNFTSSFSFGLSTADSLNDATNHSWGNGSAALQAIYSADYNVYSGTGSKLAWLIPNFENASGYGDRKYFNESSFYNTDSSSNSAVDDDGNLNPYPFGTSVTIKFVLGDYVHIYVNGEECLTTPSSWSLSSNWTIADNTPYYFSIMSVGSMVAQFSSFGYVDSIESEYLESISGTYYSAIGDSITYGAYLDSLETERYSYIVSQNLGINEKNMGQNGTVYCTGGTTNSRIDAVSSVPETSSIVTVMLGTNDYTLSDGTFANLGTFGSTDTTTIYGAINAMYSALATKFGSTSTKVYIIVPVARGSDLTSSKACTGGWYYSDLKEAIYTVAEYYGLGVINALEDITWISSYYYDGVHLNSTGQSVLAEYLTNYILADNMYDYVLDKYGF